MLATLPSRRRNPTGQHLVELCCALIFLVPFFLFLLDLTFVFFASETNKQVCRDAARAAAEVIPANFASAAPLTDPPPVNVTTNDPTYRRAQSVVEKHRLKGDKDWIRGVSLERVTVDLGVIDNSPTQLGGNVPGTVTVVTRLTARPPVPVPGVFDQINQTANFTFDLTAVRQTTIIPNEN